MKKSKILTMVTVSALVLAQAGTAFADESDIAGTVDDTVVVAPSTTGSDSSTDTQTDTSNAGDDVNDTIDSGSGVIETPTTPTTDDSSSETTPSTETDVVGETTQTETSSSDNSEDKSDTQMDSEETQTETSDSQTEQETGTVEVPTTTGETATVNTDKSQPTNNPNVSAQTAYDAGASQVGTTSQVTGQIVRDVTTANPVTLASGVTITDIQAGVATLSDGSNANLTDLGVTENADKTFTATTIDGEQVTLPETGESTLGVVVG
ncbi:cell surface protein, partial [Streptococcus pasteurianus]|nr:cell surface protein [Streptococcus pasteurianus]